MVLASAYAVSLLALWSLRVPAAVPWTFLPTLAVGVVPFAYATAHVIFALQERIGDRSRLLPPAAMALGLLMLAAYRFDSRAFVAGSLVLLVVVLWRLRPDRSGLLAPLAAATGLLVLGYAAVWNFNYVAATLTVDRLRDPIVREFDLAVYRWIAGQPLDYRGLFPLFEWSPLFRLLESAYLMLLVQVFVVLLVLIRSRHDVRELFEAVFACYLGGLGVFLLFPVVGPCIYYPESFRAGYQATVTYALMQGMATEYRAATLAAPVNGFGYFVAIPSLHVAIALVCQAFLRASPAHFWAFVPVNTLLIASTVLLGYHYLVDVPAGALLALAVLAVRWRRIHRHRGDVTGTG